MNRYCGTLLSTAVDGDLASDLVCDCTAPFAVDIFTDALADNGDPEDPENTVWRVAISGGGRINPEDYLKWARRFGVEQTFTKPVDRQELLAAVAGLLSDAVV